jgi:porphobilinogen synthase
MNLVQRPRRLRGTDALRGMVRETRMAKSSLIYPLFIREGSNIQEEILSMPGQYRYSVDRLPIMMEQLLRAGVDKIMLFGIPEHKDELARRAYHEDGIVQKALRKIKAEFPPMYCITDVCLCEYMSHGHCGVLNGHSVDNDRTLPLLAKTALSHVLAGADMVAPSDMMDGRIGAIRQLLDENALTDTPIMSYAVKYCSSFYGPFRDAAGSAPSFGDRKGYQMDYHNKKEALKEATLDVEEGADILMVKPALSYLDVIQTVADSFDLPLAAYSVSGEYSMIKAAAQAGYIDEKKIICETTTSIFRAGATMLITYYATEIAGFIAEGRIG